jgi:hypothetical protein
MKYIVCTDESYITDSRFRSISAVSFLYNYHEEFNLKFERILSESSVSEFKWQKLKDARYYYCAEKILDLVLSSLDSYQLRVDTLIWDTYDSRHSIVGRNDIANYERMFYHLLNNSMKKRTQGSSWYIWPDERCGIDWGSINNCLSCSGNIKEIHNTIFGMFYSDPYYRISSFTENKSHELYAIQVADLFSGLSVFSKESYNLYHSWKSQNIDNNLKLFNMNDDIDFSNREFFRCKLLNRFNIHCKKMKIGVSLNSKKCLFTFKPENPINFWHYEPQGKYDKAPIGNSKL